MKNTTLCLNSIPEQCSSPYNCLFKTQDTIIIIPGTSSCISHCQRQVSNVSKACDNELSNG